MKILSAVLGSIFVLFVSVAAIDASQSASSNPEVKTKQHANHEAGGCCDKTDGQNMCARDGKDAKACCNKPDCCADGCCKDGKCKDTCTCECCKDGACCKHEAAQGAKKDACCKKPAPKKPILTPAH